MLICAGELLRWKYQRTNAPFALALNGVPSQVVEIDGIVVAVDEHHPASTQVIGAYTRVEKRIWAGQNHLAGKLIRCGLWKTNKKGLAVARHVFIPWPGMDEDWQIAGLHHLGESTCGQCGNKLMPLSQRLVLNNAAQTAVQVKKRLIGQLINLQVNHVRPMRLDAAQTDDVAHVLIPLFAQLGRLIHRRLNEVQCLDGARCFVL